MKEFFDKMDSVVEKREPLFLYCVKKGGVIWKTWRSKPNNPIYVFKEVIP